MGKICVSGTQLGKWAVAIMAVAVSYAAPAQTCMVSGIVLTQTNKIIPAATLKFTHKKESTEVHIGEDGMYYSPLLPEGSYLVDIYVGATRYRAERLQLRCTSKTTYYNYRLSGTKATLYTDEYYPLSRMNAGERVPQQPDTQ